MESHVIIVTVKDRLDECRFKEMECHECKKKGHIVKSCRSPRAGGNNRISKGTVLLGNQGYCNALKHQTCQGGGILKQQGDQSCNALHHKRDPDFNALQCGVSYV